MNTHGMVHTGSTRTFMWFCMGPVLVLLIIAAIAPVTLAIIDSFRDLSLAMPSKRGQFVALDNYRDLLGSDGKFYQSLGHCQSAFSIDVAST